MNKSIDIFDKLNIYYRTGIKVLRGFLKKPFLRKSSGLLLVGKSVELSHARYISCGKNTKFEAYSEIHGLSTDGLKFGNNVTIGRFVEIRPSSYYASGMIGKGLEIGDNSSIGPNAFIGCAGKIKIGKNVMIGPKCSMFAENHNFSKINKPIKYQGVNQKGITIEDDCWIGSNVVILDGVTIGKGSVIAGDSLVTKNIPSGTVYMNKRNINIRKR
ncbi:acyltransferase [Limosilactobacillus reuteri]|uniref:acyltransferase n=1 Tax=Limosilactobacillus reuteri TaxID=1598 RepID=UPI003F984E15